jgi:hypothetical protein
MAIKLPKKTARSAKPAEVTVREALADMGWKSDAELMREAAERVLGTDRAKAAAQAAEDATRHVPLIPVPMYTPVLFDAPPILESLRREVVKLRTLVEAKSSPPIEPPQPIAHAAPEQVQPAAGVKVGSAHRPSDDDLLQELERQRAIKERGALQRTADHFGLDRSLVGKACKRAEKARAAKYGKNLVPPNDPLSSALHGTYEMGKKVKTPTH